MMIDEINLRARLVRELHGTKRKLSEVCEDLGIDYQELVESDAIGIDQCTHCSRWDRKLILDLDKNPICTYCLDLTGM